MAAAMKESGNVLQNRDRSSKASVTQMKSIAANPDYGRLGFSHSFTEGAPVIAYASDVPEVQLGREDFVVDADGKRYQVRYAVVEADTIATSHRIDGTENPLYGSDEVPTAIAGNARTTGLQEAYRQGTADKYRAEMSQDALPGIDPSVYEGMDKPILVRIMDDKDVTPDIGDVTNRSSTQQLSLVEQAQTDSQRVDLAALRYDEDGDITADSVVEFLSLLPALRRVSHRHGCAAHRGVRVGRARVGRDLRRGRMDARHGRERVQLFSDRRESQQRGAGLFSRTAAPSGERERATG